MAAHQVGYIGTHAYVAPMVAYPPVSEPASPAAMEVVMPSLYDNIEIALANHRDARTSHERYVFGVDLDDPEQVKYLEALEESVEVTATILNGYLDQVPRTKANA